MMTVLKKLYTALEMDAFNGQALGSNGTAKTVISVGMLVIVGVILITWLNGKKVKKTTKAAVQRPIVV